MRDAEAFWDRMAARYARRAIGDMPAYERTLDRTRAHLTARDRVLEIGCGTGTTALRLAGAVGHLTATDLSSAMIAIAEGRAREAGAANVRFLRAPLDGAPAVEGGFDAVLAFNLLHLVDDLPSAVRAVSERLRPGGVFVSKTICLGDAPWRVRAIVRLLRMASLVPRIVPLTVAELDAAIAAAGFRIVETDILPKSPPARFVVARRA